MILHFILHLIPIMEIKPYLFLQTYIQCSFDVITLSQEFANRMLPIKQFLTDYCRYYFKLRNMSINGQQQTISSKPPHGIDEAVL